MRTLFKVTAVCASLGCGGEDLLDSPPAAVRILSAAAAANPHNVLSSVVTFEAEGADSARVVYLGDDHSVDSTPFVAAQEGADTIVTLGLRPGTGYRNVVEVMGSSGTARSDTLALTTAPLPDLLQGLAISTTGSGGGGLTLTSLQLGGSAVFALGFDSAGTIRWYRQFDGTEPFGGELKQQPNGRFTLFRGSTHGSQRVPGHYVEFTAAGDSLRAIAVPPPRYLDNHDICVTIGPDGEERFHYFTYDFRISDLSVIGGAGEVSVAGHQLVRARADGSTEFEWDAWDHLTFEEWIEPPRPDPLNPRELDFDHPNSLGFDRDGHYIVSFRHLAQVMKIDAFTGNVVWRLGGVFGDFTFVDDPLGGFSGQHSARMLPNGNLLVYDNGIRHSPPESRAAEFALDTDRMTATLVWEFRHQPPIYTPSVGLVQRLRNGNTLVAYGETGRAVEVSPAGTVAWSADLSLGGEPVFVYRMVRIASLYRYLEP